MGDTPPRERAVPSGDWAKRQKDMLEEKTLMLGKTEGKRKRVVVGGRG